jgi:putative aldouronate transport system permease protein
VQTVTYAPHFISVVVLVGMILVFTSPRSGIINMVIQGLGREPVLFVGRPEWFPTIYVLSGVWQNAGWSAIIYLAALAAINPELHEAAIVDGAGKLQRIWHVDIPGIMPTAITLLILNLGRIMNVGFQKAYLLQNPLNLDTSEIIQTYVYKMGLLGGQYSFSAAVGLFNALINFILLVLVNRLARQISETSLW